jgi:hypothetical protein
MGTRAGSKMTVFRWLALLFTLLAVGAVFWAKRSVGSAVNEWQAKAVAYSHSQLSEAIGDMKLTKPLSEKQAAHLDDVLRAPGGAELYLYSLEGEPAYGTAPRVPSGSKRAIADAAKGTPSHVIDGDGLAVYTTIDGKGGGPVGVAALVRDYDKFQTEAAGIAGKARLPLGGLAVLFSIVGLSSMVFGSRRAAKDAAVARDGAVATLQGQGSDKKRAEPDKAPRASSTVSGFDRGEMREEPVVSHPAEDAIAQMAAAAAVLAPETEAGEPASSRKGLRLGKKEKAPKQPRAKKEKPPKQKRSLFGKKAAEVAEPEFSEEEVQTLAARLAAAAGAEQPAPPETTGDVDREVAIRQALEDQLEQLRTRLRTQEEAANQTIRELQAQLAANAQGGQADATPDGELEQQVEDLRSRLTASEQQVASVESVRAELEVRVAQLGSKASDMEQKVTELEARLREALDDTQSRAQVESLTVELRTAQELIRELESAAEARVAGEAEIERLKSELAEQIERSKPADREPETGMQAVGESEAQGEAPHDERPRPEPNAREADEAKAEPRETRPPQPVDEPEVVSEGSERPRNSEDGSGNELDSMFAMAFRSADAGGEDDTDNGAAATPTTAEASEADERSGVSDELEALEAAEDPVEGGASVAASDVPPAPSDEGRYEDVWSSAFPEPEEEAEPLDDPDTETSEGVSLEDDLWAMRERLARAGAEEGETSESRPDAPRWS